MKTLFMECTQGLAGDMILSSLVDQFEDKENIMKELNAIAIPGLEYRYEQSTKCGIVGSHIRVLVDGVEEETSAQDHDHGHEHHHDHEHKHHHDYEHEHHHDHEHGHKHHHASMKEITDIISGLNVSVKVKENAIAIYELIAAAESQVHGREVSEIHFHEVGAKDAIGDIVGICYMMEKIGPDQVISSPILTGYGHVKCAHGILPVPAPATALLLKDIPSFAGEESGEHCTPTGVAVMKHFADEFAQRPVMKISSIGYGMGTRDFDMVNCVRAFICES